jgi:hypothetical protein
MKRSKFNRKIVYACLTCGNNGPQLKSTGLTKSGNPRSPRFVCKKNHVVHKFDSTGEYERWLCLDMLLMKNKIQNLELQPKFDLIVNGQKVGTWTGDFAYFQDNERIVEDFKGYMAPTDPNTQLWKLKTAIVEAEYGVKVRVVTK